MRTEEYECGTCGYVPHGFLGHLPASLLTDEHSDTWVNAVACTGCGSIRQAQVTDEEHYRAEERYISFLEEHGLLEEEDTTGLL